MTSDPQQKIPTPRDPVGTCRHCGVYAQFGFDDREVYFGGASAEVGDERGLRCSCRQCGKESVVVQVCTSVSAANFDGAAEKEWEVTGIWPPGDVRVPDYVPGLLRDLHWEAATCLASNCLRASAVMTRSALAATLEDQGANPKSNLHAQIQEMTEKLRPQTISIADTLRLGGNAASHDYGPQWSQKEAAGLLAFLEEVLRELYETPARLDALRKLAKERGQAGIQTHRPSASAPD